MTHIIDNRFINGWPIVLDKLGIKYSENKSRYFFPCPLHNSNNYDSLSVYKDSGQWVCFVCSCHSFQGEGYGLIKFISALTKSNIKDSIQKIDKMLEGEELNLHLQPPPKDTKVITKIDRKAILPNVDGSVNFYLKKGFPPELLKKYDIFICSKKQNLLYGRVVFPIYNDDLEYAVGFIGRTLYDKCCKCGYYHSIKKDCPISTYEKIISEKWLNSKGFYKNDYLFNYWFSKDEIKKRKEIILVEGQTDCLRLEQANIKYSVGVFGTNLSENQIRKLDETDVHTVYLAFDSDKAGNKATEVLIKKLKKKYRIEVINLPKKDPGDMTVEEIHKYFKE